LLARRTAHLSHTDTKRVLAGERAEDSSKPIGGLIAWLESRYGRVTKVLIEDKANGPAIIADLKSKIGRTIPVNPEGGKLARANAIVGEVEAGNVYLPDGEAWVDEFIAEVGDFPYGEFDDDVDALSQALTAIASGTALGTFMAQAT
jgi:predicted phage terminase large subunit-like protein